MEQAHVYINGILAGILTREKPDKFSFLYDLEYCRTYPRVPVCRRMPVRAEAYLSDSLFPCFCNMLSEGSNRAIQERIYHLDPDDDWGLLLNTAGSDTIGAVTVRPI